MSETIRCAKCKRECDPIAEDDSPATHCVDCVPRADATAGKASPQPLSADEWSVEVYPHVCRGGQHVGVSAGIRMTHIPTGISVVSVEHRSQFQNRQAAEKRLREILAASSAPTEAREGDAPDIRLARALRDILWQCEKPEAGFKTNRLRNIRDIARKALVREATGDRAP